MPVFSKLMAGVGIYVINDQGSLRPCQFTEKSPISSPTKTTNRCPMLLTVMATLQYYPSDNGLHLLSLGEYRSEWHPYWIKPPYDTHPETQVLGDLSNKSMDYVRRLNGAICYQRLWEQTHHLPFSFRPDKVDLIRVKNMSINGACH